jgi:hypothetical protein
MAIDFSLHIFIELVIIAVFAGSPVQSISYCVITQSASFSAMECANSHYKQNGQTCELTFSSVLIDF